MGARPSFGELCSRIQEDIDHFGGRLPTPYALVWGGYLAALIEWGMLSVDEHARLTDMLPMIEDNPVVAILTGSPNETPPED